MTAGGWVDLAADLPGLRGSGIHALPAVAEAGLDDVLRTRGFDRRTVDLAAAEGEGALFAALQRELPLPDYFGANWDALDECLAELFATPGPPLAVVLRNTHRLLAGDVQAFLTLVALLDRAIGLAADSDESALRQCEVFVLGEGPGFG
jgi:RNAse (barnase) inhibitor barstar